jgi:hypothetical protein
MRHIAAKPKTAEQVCPLKSDAPPLGKLARLILSRVGEEGTAEARALSADLMRLGLSCEEVADLEIREPYASEIVEYARALGGGLDALVNAVVTVMSWHIQDIDREIEMLQLRRRLLERKAAAISRLAQALSEPKELRPAI